MNKAVPPNKGSKADLLMAFELFNQVIATTDLAELAKRICEQLRELSGARTVMLTEHNQIIHKHAIAWVSPERRKDLFDTNDLCLFCPGINKEQVPVVVDDMLESDLRRMLQQKQIQSMLRYPLYIEDKIIGAVILLDLPETNRAAELDEILHFLSTSIALAFKNALDNSIIQHQAASLKVLNENLEQKVTERTREIEKARNAALISMAEAEKARAEAQNLADKLQLEILERAKAQEELLLSEERYRNLFEESAEGILVVEADGSRFIYANPAVCRMFGYEHDEFCRLGIMNIHPQEFLEKAQSEFAGLSRQKTLLSHSLACLRKGGSTFFADIKASAIRLNGKQCVVGFFTDVTSRKLQEESLQRAAKLDSLGILAGGIAHDFNNLLGGIFGYIELSLDRIYDASALNFLNTAMGTIDRARALTQQLLTFSKGGNPLRKVDRLFPFVQETAMFSLSGANVVCSCRVADDLWPCVFDRNQLGQVVDNIVINARQAMNNGGSLEISADNVEIKEGMHPLLQPGKFVKISFRDTGPGVPEDVLPRIFDPFFTTKEMGHGLGLAVCYSIIRKHDGSLEVESKPGEGCTFRILLPVASEEPVQKKVRQAVAHKGSGTIVLMDDEAVLREILTSMLESLGYKVVQTIDGQQVLDWLHTHGSSCNDLAGFILDLTVPGGMGGLETAAQLKKLGFVTPIFVTSGYADDPVMANPEKYGFVASISKPFRMAELSALLKHGFDKHQL